MGDGCAARNRGLDGDGGGQPGRAAVFSAGIVARQRSLGCARTRSASGPERGAVPTGAWNTILSRVIHGAVQRLTNAQLVSAGNDKKQEGFYPNRRLTMDQVSG